MINQAETTEPSILEYSNTSFLIKHFFIRSFQILFENPHSEEKVVPAFYALHTKVSHPYIHRISIPFFSFIYNSLCSGSIKGIFRLSHWKCTWPTAPELGVTNHCVNGWFYCWAEVGLFDNKVKPNLAHLNVSKPLACIHTYIHIYIYIYICVCVYMSKPFNLKHTCLLIKLTWHYLYITLNKRVNMLLIHPLVMSKWVDLILNEPIKNRIVSLLYSY